MKFLPYLIPLILISSLWGESETDKLFHEAKSFYLTGENAKNYQERNEAFNQALFLFHSLEEKEQESSFPLELALGDTYFQLEQYPWAILYYEKGLKKKPGNRPLLLRLEKANQKIDRHAPPLSLERENLFSVLASSFYLILYVFLVTFIIGSMAIWVSALWIKKLAIFLGCCSMILFLNMILYPFFIPVEGILIRSTELYREPDLNQVVIKSSLLKAGTKVQILQMEDNDNWVKVKNQNDMMGYIPSSFIRAI